MEPSQVSLDPSHSVWHNETIDSIILLDEEQLKVLETIDKDPKIKNFAFSGPHGSGKTIVAVQCCNKMMQKYLNDETVDKIFVYVIVFNEKKSEASMLFKIFQAHFPRNSKLVVNCSTFSGYHQREKIKKHSLTTKERLQIKTNKIQTKIFYLDKAAVEF